MSIEANDRLYMDHIREGYLETDDGAKSLGGMSLGAGITYFSVGPMHSYLKDQKAVSYSSATDQEMLDAYLKQITIVLLVLIVLLGFWYTYKNKKI